VTGANTMRAGLYSSMIYLEPPRIILRGNRNRFVHLGTVLLEIIKEINSLQWTFGSDRRLVIYKNSTLSDEFWSDRKTQWRRQKKTPDFYS